MRAAPPSDRKWKVAVCGPQRPAQVALGPDFDIGWDSLGADFAMLIDGFYCRRLDAPVYVEIARDGGVFVELQEYDARRMPVIFVHGMSGTPLDFSAAIASLDRSKYQPWVLYYPSGLRLDMVSDYLVTAVRGL